MKAPNCCVLARYSIAGSLNSLSHHSLSFIPLTFSTFDMLFTLSMPSVTLLCKSSKKVGTGKSHGKLVPGLGLPSAGEDLDT